MCNHLGRSMNIVRKGDTSGRRLTAESRIFIGTIGAIGLSIAHFPSSKTLAIAAREIDG